MTQISTRCLLVVEHVYFQSVIALGRLCVLKCWLMVHMAGVIYCRSLPEAQSNILITQSHLSDEIEATRLGHCGLRKMLDFLMVCDLVFEKICNW